MTVIAEPVGRNTLRRLASKIRALSGNGDEIYFQIVSFVEHKMPFLFPGFYHEIVPLDYFPSNIHAETEVEKRVIRIREDVYDGAISGVGRDRMTLAHEIGHYALLVAKGLKLYRSFEGAKIEAFRDPEWQAKAFAGELLCPYDMIKDMSPHQISKACGVSLEAAECHHRIRNSTVRRLL